MIIVNVLNTMIIPIVKEIMLKNKIKPVVLKIIFEFTST